MGAIASGVVAEGALPEFALGVIAHIGRSCSASRMITLITAFSSATSLPGVNVERMCCIAVEMLATRIQNIQPRAALRGVLDEEVAATG